MANNCATFRFYEELNDFLLQAQRKREIVYPFHDHPGIKDSIEALGVPHSEVDLIIVNGQSVGFDYPLQDGDRVAIYPMFESLDITPLLRLRPQPLRVIRFVVDVNLGKLARMLRWLGFDTLYRNDYQDREIVDISVKQQRIILTRDRRLLYAKAVTHGYWVREVDPERQIKEILTRFDLRRQIIPYARCQECNGLVSAVDKAVVLPRLEPKTIRYYNKFYQCADCGKVYWKGSHYSHMQEKLQRLLEDAKL